MATTEIQNRTFRTDNFPIKLYKYIHIDLLQIPFLFQLRCELLTKISKISKSRCFSNNVSLKFPATLQ